jgi:peroxiredoxin Q/BCP
VAPKLKPGDKAPDLTLLDQKNEGVQLSSLRGRRALVYFYPKADTPGCTQQARGLNEILGDIGGGVSGHPNARARYALGRHRSLRATR